MRRMSVSSSENFEGKLFVQFLALIYLSYIKKQMDEKGLYKKYTMQTLLDDLDIIELYQQPGRAHHLSEISGASGDTAANSSAEASSAITVNTNK